MWHQKGIPVIPFALTWNEKKQEHEKRPVVETWKQWQDRSQTKEEFDALKIEEYTMFGVVCGTKLSVEGETVHLIGVDRDIKDPNISVEIKQKTLHALNQMRTTYREKTRSGGNHLIYFSRTPVKGAKPRQLYAESQGGTHFLFRLPRYLHVVLGALAMTGGLTTLLGHLAADDAGYSRFARTSGLTLLTVAAVAEVPVALWYQSTLPAEGAAAVQPWILIAAGAAAVLGYVVLLMGGTKQRRPLLAWLGMAGLTVTGVFLAVQRHLVRQAIMAPNLTAADWKLQPQWDVFAIFAVLLVGTLGLIAYLVVRFFREAREQENKLARSAD
jgi:hypothetical protein